MKLSFHTAILFASLITSGCVTSTQKVCRTDCDDCVRTDDFCPDAIPAKPGTYVQGWNDAMRCAAHADGFVVHRNSWFNGGLEPGPQAVEDLQRFAELMSAGGDHLIVEVEPVQPAYNETLAEAKTRTEQTNQARYNVVVTTLTDAGLANASSRVHLSSLEPVGNRGIEAPRVFQQLFFGGNGNRGGQGQGQGGQGQGGLGGGRGF